jgi:hypothetical protein
MAFLGLFGPPNVEKLKAKGKVKGLIKALRYKKGNEIHQSATIREKAAEALGAIGGPRAVEPLIAALEDEDKDVRQATAKALVSIFREGSLTEKQKREILSLRGTTIRHTDHESHIDHSGDSNRANRIHTDRVSHKDSQPPHIDTIHEDAGLYMHGSHIDESPYPYPHTDRNQHTDLNTLHTDYQAHTDNQNLVLGKGELHLDKTGESKLKDLDEME